MKAGKRLRRVGQLSMVLGVAAIALAVWGVFRVGQTLRAPAALASGWEVSAGGDCTFVRSRLTLSQSGKYVRALWPGGPAEVLEGVVDVDGRAELHNVTPPTCGAAAVVTGAWHQDGLDGVVTLDGCGVCPTFSLTARPAP